MKEKNIRADQEAIHYRCYPRAEVIKPIPKVVLTKPYESANAERQYLLKEKAVDPTLARLMVDFVGFLQSVANFSEETKAKNPWQSVSKYRILATIDAYLARFYRWAKLPDAEIFRQVVIACRKQRADLLAPALRQFAEQIQEAIR